MANDERVKQVLVMRAKYVDPNGNSIGLRKGKYIAQGGHGYTAWLINKVLTGDKFTKVEREWLESGTRKICLKCDSEAELLEIHKKAQAAGLISHIVQDSGTTEFHGVPTYTCVAIGPDWSSKIDEITGHLEPY